MKYSLGLIAVFLVFSITILFTGVAFGETWKVTIPSGASDIDHDIHFSPQEISIRVGDKVEWGNADNAIHTVTSGSLETGIDDWFNSGYLEPGEKFSRVFDDLGEVRYFCAIHPWLGGIINVINLPVGFQVYHNAGSEVSDETFDVQYKVTRNLTDIQVDPVRKTIVFSFVGKIDNDTFIVKLPEGLIKNPQGVWVNDSQIMNFKSESVDGAVKLTIPLGGTTTEVKVLGSEVAGEIKPKPFTLINQVLAVADKKIYYPEETITISGEVRNISQLTEITPHIISPTGVTLYAEPIILMGPKFTIEVSTDVLREFGPYTIEFEGEEIRSQIIYFDYKLVKKPIPPPKKQMADTTPERVVCNEGLELMKKVSDGSAVCLKPSTAVILFNRGWASGF